MSAAEERQRRAHVSETGEPIVCCRQCGSPETVDCAECTHGICAACVGGPKMRGSHGHGNKPGPDAFARNDEYLRGIGRYAKLHPCPVGFENTIVHSSAAR